MARRDSLLSDREGGEREGQGGRQRCVCVCSGGVSWVQAFALAHYIALRKCLWARHRDPRLLSITRRRERETVLTRELSPGDRSASLTRERRVWRTYLWTVVLDCRSWGPAPRRWLSVQTWPSVLCYLISSWGIIQLQTQRSRVSGVASSAHPVHT